MLRLSDLTVFFLLLSMSSSYLIGVFGSSMGMIDDLASLAILLTPFFYLIIFKHPIKKLHNQLFVFTVFFYVVVTFLFLFSSLFSHLYELYKLLTFMLFIPLFMVMQQKSIYDIDNKLLFTASTFLAINAFIVILQYTINPNIINIFGMKIGMDNIAFAAGRYAGLFSNPNNLGDFALLLYLLNEMVRPQRYRQYWIISVLAVLLSTSKHAIVILLIMFAYENRNMIVKNLKKFLLGFVFIVLAASLTYSFNQAAFDSKINQYMSLAQAEDISQINMGTVESRAQKMIDGMKLVDEYFPLGSGLGTWGDASSKFNVDNHLSNPESMSDSAFMHILVEQGIFMLVYFLVIFSGYFSVKQIQKKYFFSLMLMLMLAIFPTMGMSSGSWPLIFSYLYVRLLFSKRLV